MRFNFEWDQNKANTNLQKHGVSFDEAVTVFTDPLTITITDATHSDTEARFIDLGLSSTQRLLVVVYTECNETIRIKNI
jgi:uncharacterized DUF497 family protein